MIRRILEYLVARAGGWVEWPYEYEGPPPVPDGYDASGNPIYDMSKRLLTAKFEELNHFTTLMNELHLTRDPRPKIIWLEPEEDG